jgi:hypothetical protein
MPLDDQQGIAGDVVVMSAEDGLADTIRPRLDAAGADLAWVHAVIEVRTVTDTGVGTRVPVLPDDLDLLERVIVERGGPCWSSSTFCSPTCRAK